VRKDLGAQVAFVIWAVDEEGFRSLLVTISSFNSREIPKIHRGNLDERVFGHVNRAVKFGRL
jgi:hypothetical protein